ncbi:MAG: PAS domain S-box protein [Candidatus Electrothrix sp. AR4]|nr:PAS domain S-box protein [Candidatus Electrothrix sp. AR4]
MSGFFFSIVLIIISMYSYLLFHSLVELFSVSVAIIMFVVAWHTYKFSRNHFLMYLGCGYLWIALLDLLHTLIYKGMTVFPALTGGNPGTQFWIAARYLESLLLLTSPIFMDRALNRKYVMIGLAAITTAVVVAILGGQFPVAYLDGTGLTPFKVYSEYIIITIMISAGLFIYRRRALLDPRIYHIMLTGIALSIGADLAFTFYVSVYGLSNLIGHFFKLFSFWLIYEAIIHTTLHEPFVVMARGSSTYNAVPQPTVLLDRDGTLRQVNKAACRESGLSETELLGRRCHSLFHPVALNEKQCPPCRALRAGKELPPIELELDPERGWRKITLSPVGTSNRVNGMVQVSTDITQRKKAEAKLRTTLRNLDKTVERRTQELHAKVDELEQTRDQLVASEKMASLGRLVAGFAHEINTPVGIAVGAASQLLEVTGEITQMLSAEEVNEEELEEVLDTFTEASQLTLNNLRRAADLVQRFKRSSIDQATEELRYFEVREVIEDTLASLHNRLKKTRIQITINCSDELRIISIPGILEQILINCIQNSLMHGFNEKTRAGEIHIACGMKAGLLHMEYRDNGNGMDPDTLTHLFEPFFTTKRGGGGSGLGMYICYNLVHRHQGSLYCESELGKGVRFYLDLPTDSMTALQKQATSD